MKNGLIATGLLGATLGLTAQKTQAQTEQFYIRGGVGPMRTDTAKLQEFAFEDVSHADLHFDTGFNFDVAFGYQVTPWFAVEGVTGLSYNRVDVKKTLCADGDLAVGRYPFMANVVFQLPNRTHVIPFAGAGAGGAVSVLAADDFKVGNTTADGTFGDFGFAYHCFGGVRYDFNPTMGISVYYRYLTTEASKWEPDMSIGASGDIRVAALHSHSVNIGFTFRF